VGIGIAMTSAYSFAGALLPPDAHVTGFGFMTTASVVGLAFSPVLAGVLGKSGLLVVFAVDVALLLALAVTVALRLRPVRAHAGDGPPGPPQVPAP
jgi:MFS family permease